MKFSKLELSLDPFIQRRKCMSFKLTGGGLCIVTMINDVKFEIELTCYFKNDRRNLTNFDPSTQKSQKFALYGLILTKMSTVLNLFPIQVVISLPGKNSPWASYCFFVCAISAAFFSYVGGIPVTNYFHRGID